MPELISEKLLNAFQERFYFEDTVAITPFGQIFKLNSFSISYLFEADIPVLYFKKDELANETEFMQKIYNYQLYIQFHKEKYLKKIIHNYAATFIAGRIDSARKKNPVNKILSEIIQQVLLITGIPKESKDAKILLKFLDEFLILDPAKAIEEIEYTLFKKLKPSLPQNIHINSNEIKEILNRAKFNSSIKEEVYQTILSLMKQEHFLNIVHFLSRDVELKIFFPSTREQYNTLVGYAYYEHADKTILWSRETSIAHSRRRNRDMILPLILDSEGHLKYPFPKPQILGGGFYSTIEQNTLEIETMKSSFGELVGEELTDYVSSWLSENGSYQKFFKLTEKYQQAVPEILKRLEDLSQLAELAFNNKLATSADNKKWEKISNLLKDYLKRFQATAPKLITKAYGQKQGEKSTFFSQHLQEREFKIVRTLPENLVLLETQPVKKLNDKIIAETIWEFIDEAREVLRFGDAFLTDVRGAVEVYGRLPYLRMRYPKLSEYFLKDLFQYFKPIDDIIIQLNKEVTPCTKGEIENEFYHVIGATNHEFNSFPAWPLNLNSTCTVPFLDNRALDYSSSNNRSTYNTLEPPNIVQFCQLLFLISVLFTFFKITFGSFENKNTSFQFFKKSSIKNDNSSLPLQKTQGEDFSFGGKG